MSSRSVLQRAKKLLSSRRFSTVIKLLRDQEFDFRESFEYYYLLGVACMYLGDIGGAGRYFESARKISVLDTRLLVAQAALFLRRGDTGRAVEYYLDIQENDPSNKIARDALEFIRLHGTPDVISEWVSSGKIKKFYPPLGIHPAVPAVLFTLAACLLFVVGAGVFVAYRKTTLPPPRVDLSEFVLTVDERNNALQEDLSGGVYRYILTPRQVNEAYSSALSCFQEYRDNVALVEVNRILHSNASALIKQNVRMLKEYLTEPTFDTIKDSFPYAQVAADPYLYLDCWVVWSGRVTNVEQGEESFACDLLVGYETQRRVEGIVPLVFDSAMDIDPLLPVKVLGRLGVVDGKLRLFGKSVYQPLDGSSL